MNSGKNQLTILKKKPQAMLERIAGKRDRRFCVSNPLKQDLRAGWLNRRENNRL